MAQSQNGVMQKDDNGYPVGGGVSSSDNSTVLNLQIDPITNRLLTDASVTISSVSITGSVNVSGSTNLVLGAGTAVIGSISGIGSSVNVSGSTNVSTNATLQPGTAVIGSIASIASSVNISGSTNVGINGTVQAQQLGTWQVNVSGSTNVQLGAGTATIGTVNLGTTTNTVFPFSIPTFFTSGFTGAITATSTTSVLSAPPTGLRNYVTHIIGTNSHATVGTVINIQDGSGGATLYKAYAAPVGGGFSITLPTPLRQPTTATGLFCVNETTGSNTYVSASGYQAP